MGTKFTQSFKIQAVEKALERAGDMPVKEIRIPVIRRKNMAKQGSMAGLTR